MISARKSPRRRLVDVYIVGAGGQARETFHLVEATRGLRFRGYLVDEEYAQCWGSDITGGKILGPPSLLAGRDGIYYVGIGAVEPRDRLIRTLGEERLGPPLIALGAHVHRSNHLANGTIVCAGATFTVDASIAMGVIVNCNASIAHDVRVGRCSTISPGAIVSGNVTIGSGAWIGAGATIIEKRTIADGVVVGAGAVVVRDLLERGTYVGVPARLRQR